MNSRVVMFLFIFFFTFNLRAEMPLQLKEMFSAQIKSELDGAYTYLLIAQKLGEKSYDGAYFWYTQQYYEELNHARMLMDHMIQRGESITFYPTEIEIDQNLDISLVDAFRKSYELEKRQTQKIKTLYKKAREMDDFESEVLLKWFVFEQVQEENHFFGWLDKLEMVKDDPQGLLFIDKELKLRPAAVVFVPGGPLPPQ